MTFKMTFTKDTIRKFLKDKFDVNLEHIYKELSLTPKDLPMLEVYLEELIKEKWITKSMTDSGYYEYDSGKKQSFGGVN